jgi:L-2-hydroxyglutarate oxidase LhgO
MLWRGEQRIGQDRTASTAQHSTAQHSTAQHSTAAAQHRSINPIPILFVGFVSVDILICDVNSMIPIPSFRCFSSLSKSFNRQQYDIVIIGGGIVGLSTARNLLLINNKLRLAVAEKEESLAQHQSSHNSGVIHAGIYYSPQSRRAQLCRQGVVELYNYCDSHKIPYRKAGKLIVATEREELERLEQLYSRGMQNGVPELRIINSREINELEPNVQGLAAIDSPSTGIIDFQTLANSYAQDIRNMKGDILTNFKLSKVENLTSSKDEFMSLYSPTGCIEAKRVITCVGLYSDHVAAIFGGNKSPAIVPFRGTWLQIKPQYNNFVRRNIYPVPNPNFPFLGTHLTPTINNSGILIGPNAALAFAREGYSFNQFNFEELLESLKLKGLQIMISKHWRFGLNEMASELLPSMIALKQVQRYTANLTWDHIQTQPLFSGWASGPKTAAVKSGVRAQAISEQGDLIEDFIFEEQNHNILHVRNAPSPAATSSITIGHAVARKAMQLFSL